MPGQVLSGLRRIWEACIEIRAADSYYWNLVGGYVDLYDLLY